MKEEDKTLAFFVDTVLSGGMLHNLEVESIRGCNPTIYDKPIRLEPVCDEFNSTKTYVDTSDIEMAKPLSNYCEYCEYRVVRIFFPLSDDVMWVETEQALSTLLGYEGPFSFEAVWDGTEISYYFAVPKSMPVTAVRGVFERIDKEIIVVEQDTDPIQTLPGDDKVSLHELCVEPPYYTELFNYKNRIISPLLGLLKSMARMGKDSLVVYQLLFEPVTGAWGKNIKNAIEAEQLLKRRGAGSSTLSKELKDFTSKPLFAVRPRIYSSSSSGDVLECVKTLTGDFQLGGKNVFCEDMTDLKKKVSDINITELVKKRASHMTGVIMNSTELVGFVHLPDKSIKEFGLPIKYLDGFRVPDKLLGDGIPVGEASLYGVVHVPYSGMSMNIYSIGKSGSGKSHSIKEQINFHIRKGHGLALFDPHGMLAEEVLSLDSLRDRVDDVCVFNPCDEEYVLDYNPFYIDDISDAGRLASDYVNSNKTIFSASGGYRINHILGMSYNGLLVTGRNLNSMPLLWSRTSEGDRLRREVISKSTNSEVKRFFDKEMMEYSKEAFAPIHNRISTLLMDDRIQRVFSRTESKVNLTKIMNDGKILIVSLPVGLLGAEISSQLGSMMLAQLQKAAFHRKEGSKPFFIFADECYRFEGALGIYESFLNETRKFSVYLNLCHQSTGQVSDDVLKSFLSASNIFTFGINIEDAKRLSRVLDNRIKPEELVGLGVGEVVARIDNAIVKFKTFPPSNLKTSDEIRKLVIRCSHEKYYTKLSEIKEEPQKSKRIYDSF